MAQTTSFNLTVDDISPQIIYSPASAATFTSSPNLAAGWGQQFTGSGFASVPGQLGTGESLHVTEDDGASLTIGFTGSAIYLYGQARGSTFSLSLDDHSVTVPLGTLASLADASDDSNSTILTQITGLSEGGHILTLTSHFPDQIDDSTPTFFVFDRAVVTIPTNLTDATVSTKTISDSDMQFNGSWYLETDALLIPDGDNSYHITQTGGDFASYSFQGSSVSVTGLLNSTAGLFNVSLSSNASSSVIEQQQLSSFSPFLVYTTLFSASGLDPTATYTLTITNIENRTLALNGLNVTVVSGGTTAPSEMPSASSSSALSSKHGLSQGAIAGLAIGVSLTIVLLITALVYLYVRNRKRRRWWGGQGGSSSFATSNFLDPPRHRRVQPASLVDANPRPGQGLENASPKSLSYDYRSIAHDDGMMMEIGAGYDGDSDLGHGYGQKKSIASLYSTNDPPRDASDPSTRAPLPPPGAETNLEGSKGHRQSTQSVTRWSTIFGSPTRSSFRRSQITPGVGGVPAVPDVPILAPIPKRVAPPDGVLTKEKLRDPSRRSSSHSSTASDNGFLDIPRTSPFAVEFGGSSSSSERRVNRQRSRSFAEGSVGHTASNALTSFLDFASSAASSFRGSSRSRSRKRQSSSNRSGLSKGTGTQRSRRTKHTSSGSGTNSTGVWTLTLSVDRNGSQSSPRPQLSALNTASSHPFALSPGAEQPESPTDSLPMSVSDINFRVDDDEDDALSNRPGRGVLPRHPPLPDTPRSFALTSLNPNDSLHRFPSPAGGMAEQRQPYVAQTVIGRRLAEARQQSQETESNSATGSRNNSTHVLTHNPSNSILSIISDRRRPSRSRSRNTSFMNFGRGSGS